MSNSLILSKDEIFTYNKPVWIERHVGDNYNEEVCMNDWAVIEGEYFFDKERVELYWFGNEVHDLPYLKDYGVSWIAYKDHPESKNECLNDALEYSARLIYQLFKICDVSKEDAKKLFRPVKLGIGDYMGTGYYFLDCFNKIYSEYLYTCPEVLSRLIQYNIDLDKGENKK